MSDPQIQVTTQPIAPPPAAPQPEFAQPELPIGLAGWGFAVAVGAAWVWRTLQNRSPKPVVSESVDQVLDTLAYVLTAHTPFRGIPPQQLRQRIPDLEAVARLIEVPTAVEELIEQPDPDTVEAADLLSAEEIAKLRSLLNRRTRRKT